MRPVPGELNVKSFWDNISTKGPSREVEESKRAPRKHLENHFEDIGNNLEPLGTNLETLGTNLEPLGPRSETVPE